MIAMTDDIMTRVREWLESCVRVATENGVPEEADLEAATLAHIDGEPARLAAAREEQREACIRLIEAFRTGEKYIQLTPEQRRLGLVGSINAQPSAATPLADEIASLRAEVVSLRAHQAAIEAALEPSSNIETTLGGRVKALRARVAELEEVAARYLEDKVQFHKTMSATLKDAAAQLERAEKAEARVAELEVVESRIEHMRTWLNEWKRKHEEVEARVAQLGKDRKAAVHVLARVEIERDELRARLTTERLASEERLRESLDPIVRAKMLEAPPPIVIASERSDIVDDLRIMASTFKGAMSAWREALEWAAERYEKQQDKEG
jgi:chromosome segregation ATPase